MKIAIIDDDPISQFLCRKLIEKISPSHQLQVYANGLVAYEFFKTHAHHPGTLPELILLDINMPAMNGWQFLDALRSLQVPAYKPSIYIISSSLDDADHQKAKNFEELRGFLNKPLSQQQMRAVIDRSEPR